SPIGPSFRTAQNRNTSQPETVGGSVGVTYQKREMVRSARSQVAFDLDPRAPRSVMFKNQVDLRSARLKPGSGERKARAWHIPHSEQVHVEFPAAIEILDHQRHVIDRLDTDR